MIESGKRKAVLVLHEEGISAREIALQLHISRDSVSRIIKEGAECKTIVRSDQKQIDPELVRALYSDCKGYIQRVHEKLADQGIEIGYSTLGRVIRRLDLSTEPTSRCSRVPDRPGAEMQHDTSPYRPPLAGIPTPVVASLLYFRYCKQRYLKFYRLFTRFQMKCFFYEALTHFNHAAPICVIDNTNLARLHGTGSNAVFVPEMVAFAGRFGFEWLAHEKGHSDRKAGEERSFWTVETNFFPGRTFSSLEDMNEQARIWATEKMANRPQTKARIVPNLAFETEKPYLKKLPAFVPEPYIELGRGTDQYGYTAFDGNYYWIPGTRVPAVRIQRYGERIEIYEGRKLLCTYPLPPFGTKNRRFPEGKDAPPHQPKNRKDGASHERETILRTGPEAQAYLKWVDGQKSLSPAKKAQLYRELSRLRLGLTSPLFLATIERARKYGVTDPKRVERIACLLVRDSLYEDGSQLPVDTDIESREIYQQGKLSAPADLRIYDERYGVQMDLPLDTPEPEPQEEGKTEEQDGKDSTEDHEKDDPSGSTGGTYDGA